MKEWRGVKVRNFLSLKKNWLLASPPPCEDCEDDEVFVRDPHPTATSSPRCDELLLPPPLPPPPPTTSQASLAQGLDHFPPPPPKAVCLAQWEEGYLEPRASSSKLAKVTVAKERSMPDAAHLVDNQLLGSRSQTSGKSFKAKETNPPSTTGALPQPAGSLSKQQAQDSHLPCRPTASSTSQPVGLQV